MTLEGDREELARDELDFHESIHVCRSDRDSSKSVARIQLVKTEYPSAYVTVSCKGYTSAIALLLLVAPSWMCRVWINPISNPNTVYKSRANLWIMKISHKVMVRSDISKPALIFFFTARVHTTKSTVKILAANTHCKYFFKIAEHCQYCNLPDPWRNVHP
jgi:hypothetical protein